MSIFKTSQDLINYLQTIQEDLGIIDIEITNSKNELITDFVELLEVDRMNDILRFK